MDQYSIFSLIVILQYMMDRCYNNCETYNGEVLLIIHHIMSVYIYLGGFLFNSTYHLLFILLILFHWITNNNRCELTTQTNKYCGYNKDKKFNDIIKQLNLEEMIPNFHYYYLFFMIMYDVNLLNQSNR